MITWKEAVTARLIEQELERKRQKDEETWKQIREAEAKSAFRRWVEAVEGFTLSAGATVHAEETAHGDNYASFGITIVFGSTITCGTLATIATEWAFELHAERGNNLTHPGWLAFRADAEDEATHGKQFDTLLDAAIWALDLKLEDFNDD